MAEWSNPDPAVEDEYLYDDGSALVEEVVVEEAAQESVGRVENEPPPPDPPDEWFNTDGPVLPAGIFICDTTFCVEEYVEIVLVAL